MAFTSCHKYAQISSRKVRPLANMVRGKFADEALDILRYQPSRGARLLETVLKSAIGNAQDPEQNKGRSLNVEELVVLEAHIDGGPVMKRIRPMSRGQAFGILKRTAHITVTLVELEEV
ncbi:MAG: 50S ribosomal protein L22 [Pirellulaceae bacterium]|nr:50S ribosomal protein L22 [Pirellulaceae bacterium]